MQACSSTNEEKIGDIGACDQQNRANSSKQHQQGQAHSLGGILRQWENFRSPALVVERPLLFELPCDSGHLLSRIGEGDAAFETCNYSQEMAALPFLGPRQRERRPYFGLGVQEGKSLRHDTDHET